MVLEGSPRERGAPQGLLRCSSGSGGGSLVVTWPGLWPWSPMGPTAQTWGSASSMVSWQDESSVGKQEAPWPCLHGPPTVSLGPVPPGWWPKSRGARCLPGMSDSDVCPHPGALQGPLPARLWIPVTSRVHGIRKPSPWDPWLHTLKGSSHPYPEPSGDNLALSGSVKRGVLSPASWRRFTFRKAKRPLPP